MAKMGRPKADITKKKVVSVRMTPEEFDRLKEYADSLDMTVTQVVQQGVNSIIEKQKETH